jgi:succinyl-CoA synthetase beta subunit
VVKAQVHAGGRGKAGGVKLANSRDDLETAVKAMLGTRLITKQSAPSGQPVNSVLVQTQVEIAREFYLALLVDRAAKRLAIVASSAGGMDIEEVAASQPEKILRLHIDPVLGLQDYQCRRIAFALGLNAEQRQQLGKILHAAYRLFLERDLSLLELNPLIVDSAGHLLALDAKISLDDNALFRQRSLAEWRDPSQEDPKEAEAKRHDLSYVALDGSIGCMVNGAGLAMATMDIIKLQGGHPANFLDVGGTATAERVAEAFKIILSDHNVRAILVNIFGGIVRCDLIAEGIIAAVREADVRVPVVARLEGNQAERAREILAASGLAITPAADLDEAARLAVGAVRS